ncbi:MAG: putative Histidine kinase [Myxococcales bacterium]|nr:putative Histidine kinase [Myxococcales bacterium]
MPPARVLLVEDDADSREALASLLAVGGFEVASADCGEAAVRTFAAGRFDAVLTDLDLPDLDGWEVARRIRRLAPALPIALITGWTLALDANELRLRGVDLVLTKPVDPRRIIGALQRLLQRGGRNPSA